MLAGVTVTGASILSKNNKQGLILLIISNLSYVLQWLSDLL